MPLSGRLAVVTGASRGIGQATALAWAAAGADVVIAARDIGALNATRRRILELGRACAAVQCDVSDEVQVERLRVSAEAMGHVSLLLNCAGVPGRYARVTDLSVREWNETMAVNVRGTFSCCKAFVPTMASRRFGSVINVASSDRALPLMSAYHASKFAVVALTQSLAGEVANSGVAVNAVRFGVPVDTDLARQVNGGTTDYSDWQRPEDVTDVLTHLATQTTPFVTGGYINVLQWREQMSGPVSGAATPPGQRA